MLKKPSVHYVIIAAVALFVGLLVYLLDRQPAHTYFLSHALTPAYAPYALFGVAGNYLSAFLHVYAFMLLTVVVAGSSNARLIRIGAVWFVIASLFEFGQHLAVSPLIAASLPTWFAHIPVLDNTAAYFLKGTFDTLDLLSSALGTLAACFTVVLARNSEDVQFSKKSLHSAFRYLALGGISLFGMLSIVGSGGGETSVPGADSPGPTGLYIDVANDRLYVVDAGNSAVLVYDNASLLNGAVTPDRTLAGDLTALSAPKGIYVDTTRNLLYVSNGTDQILVFNNAASAGGNTAPVGTIDGLDSPGGIFVDVMADRLYVANTGANSVLVFDNASTAASASLPDRTLSGGLSSLNQPRDLFVDTGTDRLYVTNASDDSVLVFNDASTADDPVMPDRVLNLTASTVPWGIYVDDTPVLIGSTASLDGFTRSDGTASASGSPATGDKDSGYSLGVGWRQLYSFDIADISASATIASAILRLYQCDVQGLPYTSLGNVIVDQMNYGDVFDPFGSAYSGGAVALNIGTLSTTTSLGYRSLSVTARVQSDLSASRERSQYRLLFSMQDFDFDGNDDFVQFTDAEDSLCAGTTTNKPPQLAVTLDNNSQLYISGNSNSTLLSYNDANTVSGSTVANRIVAGGLTTLNAPRGIAVDMARNQIYVANFGDNSILVFDNARTVTGGTAPSRVITP